jgi:hypothetical protein
MSFDAKSTWDVWRRILREPNLQAILRAGDLCRKKEETQFSDDELAIAQYYQSHFKDAEWFVTSYRFRLVSAFMNAMELAAPLTHRVLLANGHDVRKLAEFFFDGTGWFDDGPFVYRLAAKILEWLPQAGQLANLHELNSVTKLETAAVGVLRDAALVENEIWEKPVPDRGELLSQTAAGKELLWTGLARVVETDHDVAALFSAKDPHAKGPPNLPKKHGHFLAYLPSKTQKHRFVRIQPEDFTVAETLARNRASSDFITQNIGSIAKFSKIRAVCLSEKTQ